MMLLVDLLLVPLTGNDYLADEHYYQYAIG